MRADDNWLNEFKRKGGRVRSDTGAVPGARRASVSAAKSKPAEQAGSLAPAKTEEAHPDYDSDDRKGRISVFAHSWRLRRDDPDNLSCKAVLDGMVACGILRDDNRGQLASVTLESHRAQSKGKERTVIELWR